MYPMWVCKCWDLKSSNYGNEPSVQAVGGMQSPLLSLYIPIRNEDPGLMGRSELKMFHCAESQLHCLNKSGNKGRYFWNNGGSLCLFQQVWLWERKGTLSLQPFTACLKIGFNELCNYLATCCCPPAPPANRLSSVSTIGAQWCQACQNAHTADIWDRNKEEKGIFGWGEESEAEELSETEKLLKTPKKWGVFTSVLPSHATNIMYLCVSVWVPVRRKWWSRLL